MQTTFFVLLFSVLCCISLTATSAKATEKESIVYTRDFAESEYGGYYVSVLQAALDATSSFGTTKLEPHPQPMNQNRQLVSLIKGDGDVMWSVTNRDREQKLIPIKLPLLKGYAGYRVLVIHPDNQSEFNFDISSNTLKTRTFVQGSNWPDLNVLKLNGFNVEGEDWSLWFNSMYSMVERELVDAFPRNIIEVHRDLSRHANRQLSIEQHHLMIYPNYEYFFVSPSKPELANRLRTGLIILLENGKLQELFTQSQWHKKAESLANSSSRKKHYLDNPTIPYKLDYVQWDDDTAQAINALKKDITM